MEKEKYKDKDKEQIYSIINRFQIDYLKIIRDLKNEIVKLNNKNKLLENITIKAITNSERANENNKDISNFYTKHINKMKCSMNELIKMNDEMRNNYSKAVLRNHLLMLDLKEKKDIISYFESQNYELFVPSYSISPTVLSNVKIDKNEITEIRSRLRKIIKQEDTFITKINYLSDILLKKDFIFNSVSSELLYFIKDIDVENIENEREACKIFMKIYDEISKIVGIYYI